MKTCSKCKQEKLKTEFYSNKRTKDGLQFHCKDCIKDYSKTDAYKASIKRYQSQNWRGIATVIKSHMKTNSAKRGHLWDDSWWSIDGIVEQIKDQKCAVTGLPFELKKEDTRYKKRAFIPSPDRKDNSKGYEPNNVQWVLFIYNMMKNDFDDVDVAHFLLSLKYLEDSKDIKDLIDSRDDYDV
jgi:hypothetical protein